MVDDAGNFGGVDRFGQIADIAQRPVKLARRFVELFGQRGGVRQHTVDMILIARQGARKGFNIVDDAMHLVDIHRLDKFIHVVR